VKIFMTGATGYIGSAITGKLLRAGHRVVGLARSDASAATLERQGAQPHRGDLHDLRSLTDAARAADGVIHNAFDAGSHDFEAATTNEAHAVDALLAGLRDTGRPLVFTSGTGVLGDTGTAAFDEDTPIDLSGNPAAAALQTRLDTETTVRHATGVRGIVLRPPNVYGRGDGRAVLWLLRAAARTLGAVPYAAGSADHLWSFVHVDDLADLFVRAIDAAPGGELFHAGAQSGLRTQDIATALSRGLRLDGRTVALEIPALADALGSPQMAAYWASNSQSSSAKARRVLGWEPQHLDLLGTVS
jgi:nucleoside-diphosphate-sugar epimerase